MRVSNRIISPSEGFLVWISAVLEQLLDSCRGPASQLVIGNKEIHFHFHLKSVWRQSATVHLLFTLPTTRNFPSLTHAPGEHSLKPAIQWSTLHSQECSLRGEKQNNNNKYLSSECRCVDTQAEQEGHKPRPSILLASLPDAQSHGSAT